MDFGIVFLLFCAGIAGGLVNALAGGATLITFPAMLAAGLPPVVANASNAVAVSPGHLMAALGDRSQLPASDRQLGWLAGMALAGGGIGAWLLFVTPEHLFTLLVPPLIAAATVIFAFGQKLRALLPEISGGRARQVLLGLVSVYGGYFGAGLGVMLLAVLAISGSETARAANALKNLLATAVSFVTIMVFALTGLVAWPQTLIVLAGAMLGGLAGAKLTAVLAARAVRRVVITIGTIMTFVYAWRYWY